MQLNGYDLTDRYNRPSVGSKVAIRTQFMNNGTLIDPYDISACTIFQRLANASPSSILDDTTNILKTGLTLGPTGVVMNFGVSGGAIGTADVHTGIHPYVTSERVNNTTWFPDYEPGVQASGIYRVSAGDYVAVLDGTRDLSGGYNMHSGFNAGSTVANSASALTEYIDVWTVKLFQDSDWQVFINNFTLYNDTFLALTEPLILTTSNRLATKHMYIGAKQDIVITTDITVGNRNLSEEVKNIIQDYGISATQFSLKRIKEGYAVPGSTSITTEIDDVRVTADNTIIYNFDTSTKTPGTYVVEVEYEFLNQTIASGPMYFTLS